MNPHLAAYPLWIAVTLGLAACGGGGGNEPSEPPPAPDLSLEYEQVKQLKFTWSDVAGETEYRLLENPDGASGFSQVATISADSTAYDHSVFLPARLNARYMLQACNSAGCADSAEVTVDVPAMTAAIGYFKASNTDADDDFGYSVALSADGTTLAVGAPSEASNTTGVNNEGEDNNDAPESGAVYVFTRTGGAWSQQAYIKSSTVAGSGRFGTHVALAADGNTLAVGEPFDNGYQGGVSIFERNTDGDWSKTAQLSAANADANDEFGWRLALSADGNTLAVSAIFEDSWSIGVNSDPGNNQSLNSGAVYVFVRSAGLWGQQAYIKSDETDEQSFFGWSLSLSADGNTLAVGERNNDSVATGVNNYINDFSADNSGAAYVFTRTNGNWSRQAYIKASNTEAGDQFGYSVALSGDGNTLAVGAREEDSNATGVNGIEGNNTASGSGAVYIFTRTGDDWNQQAYLKSAAAGAGDYFGTSLALSDDGNLLAAGLDREDSLATGLQGNAYNDDSSNTGAVHLFRREGGTWQLQSYVKAPNTGGEDGFGGTVALSADGSTLAVGARGEASNATGIGGDGTDNSAPNSGAVYLY